jgi:hypothetical protein
MLVVVLLLPLFLSIQRRTIETAFNGGSGGGGIQWQWQHLTVFDGVGDGLRQGNGKAKMACTTRGQECGARSGSATTSQSNERMRGRGNNRTTRDNATTSRGHHNEVMR